MAGAARDFHPDTDLHASLGDDPSTVKCVQFFYNITTNKDYSKVIPMVINSGKAINDFGFYDACNNSTDTRYFTLRPDTNKYDKKLFYGACLPSYCDIGTINEFFVPYFTQQIAPGIENINDVASGTFTFKAIDPGFGGRDELSTVGILTLALVSALGIVSCIGSCFNAGIAKRDSRWARNVRNKRNDSDDYENMMDDDVESNESVLVKFTRSFDFFDNFKRIFADNEKAYFQMTY